MSLPIIDAHHHFWDPEDGDYAWLSGPYAPIRKIFSPLDLKGDLVSAGVEGTVLVQTWSSLAETRRFLALTEKTDFILGVVGWVDLTDPEVGSVLADLRRGPGGARLVGIRHQVHDEPDPEWLNRPDVRRGLAAVADLGLVFDLLVRPRELPAAFKTVSAFPDLRFAIDHIAKPDIAGGRFEPWATGLHPFGTERKHVWCKLSGMVTEADWGTWRPEDLRPYVAEVLRIFGADRCLFGSDWPVCLVAGDYGRVLGALQHCVSHLPIADQASIFAGAARDLYRLTSKEFPA
jgi:L-fuconolactonase